MQCKGINMGTIAVCQKEKYNPECMSWLKSWLWKHLLSLFFPLSWWMHSTVKVHKKRTEPLWIFSCFTEKPLSVSLSTPRKRSEEPSDISKPTTLDSHEMICMQPCSLAWWCVSTSQWKPVHCCLCAFACHCVWSHQAEVCVRRL